MSGNFLFDVFVKKKNSINNNNHGPPQDMEIADSEDDSENTEQTSRSSPQQNLLKSPSLYCKGKSIRGLTSKRRWKALDAKSVQQQMNENCGCLHDCYKKFSVNEVLYWRNRVHGLPEGPERMDKICQLIRMASVELKKNDRGQIFRVEQRNICRKTFISLILFISVATFTRARRLSLAKKSPLSLPKRITHGSRGKICEGFIKSYINGACDNDPTKPKYRMPSGITRIRLFDLYRCIHKEDGLEKSKFYDILKEKFPDLAFNKTQRFTKCTQCNDICELIDAETDPVKLRELEELLDCHHRQQQLEREAYYVRRGLAEMRPSEYLSVILDGMDQNKTDIPHYVKWNNPNGAGALKLRTHVTGCIAHGRGKHYFIDYNQIHHDTNLTLSCLLKVLQAESTNGKLPPTLFIQLDNTCRENKNKYFIGMIGYLVKKKFVKEAWISFLLVGHTHEDVDQSFSKISHHLSKTDAISLPELMSAITQSQKPTPTVEALRSVWDISSWLEPFINQIHNVTFPKLYRIFNDGVGHTTLHYKSLSTEDEWHPKANEKPLEIFKMQSGNQMIPPGEPDLVLQELDEDFVSDLKRSVQRDFHLAKFNQERMSWWNKFLNKPIEEPTEREREWPLTRLSNYQEIQQHSSLGEKEQELVQKYLDKRNEFKEVYTNQPEPGCSRGTHQDRRRFISGQMIIVKSSESTALLGRILSQKGATLNVQIYERKGQMFLASKDNREVDISLCFPGSFELTKNGDLPRVEKVKLQTHSLKL